MVTTSTGSPLPIRPLTVPSWIVESDIPLLPLSFTSSAELSLQEIVQQKLLKFYPSYSEVVEFISQVLRQDIRGVHQGRGKASPPPLAITDQTDPERGETTVDGGEGSGGGYQCRLDNLEIRFRIQQSEGEEDSAPERVRGAVVIEEVKYHDPKTTTTTTVKEQSSKK